VNISRIQKLLDDEINSIQQNKLLKCVTEHLVEPRLENREWDYGIEGQTYPCWICLESISTNTAIAYCEEGFGPTYPWGLLSLKGRNTSMGMDSGWFISLEQAVRDAMFWDSDNPDNYEVS